VSLTLAQSKLLTAPQVAKGFFRNGGIVDQFIPCIPIEEADSYELQIPTVTLANSGTAKFLVAGAAPQDDCAVPTDPNKAFPLCDLVGQFTVPGFYSRAFSGNAGNDQEEFQREAKELVLREQAALKVITGDRATYSEEYNGLVKLLATGQTFGANGNAANGGPLALSDIDKMLSKVHARFGRPHFLVGNFVVHEKFMALMRADKMQPVYKEIPQLEIDVPCYQNVPLLVDNNIPNTYTKGSGSNLTYLFAVVLGVHKGLCILVPRGCKDNMIDAYRYRRDGTEDLVVRLTMSLGLALYNDVALAAVDGIQTT
jgi:hypothetical protein